MKLLLCLLVLGSISLVSSNKCSSKHFYLHQKQNKSILCDHGQLIIFNHTMDLKEYPLVCKQQQLVKWGHVYMRCRKDTLSVWAKMLKIMAHSGLRSWSDKYKDLTGRDNWTTP